MKRIPKPFAVEVKRSRLSGPQHAKSQRYLLPGLAEAEQALTPLPAPAPVSSQFPPPARKPRILPDLSTGIAWAEEPALPPSDVLAPILESMAACPALDEASSLPEPVATTGGSNSESALPGVPHKQPARRKQLKGMVDDLPRGQRWKRRLPRVAW